MCLPSNWALALQIEVPDMPDEDVPSFLEIEAERGFPYGLEALSLSSSRYRSMAGKRFAMQTGVPRTHLAQLERALKAAQLRPVSFTLGITALQSPDQDRTECWRY